MTLLGITLKSILLHWIIIVNIIILLMIHETKLLTLPNNLFIYY